MGLQNPCGFYSFLRHHKNTSQRLMAIYSLNHKPIGKTTHQAGRAGAHIRYISRYSAEPTIISNGMSDEWRQAKKWMDEQEASDRSNARILDRLMVAIPIELNDQERKALVEDYLEEVTGNLIPWYAAIHETGDDMDNPHAHIIIRDRSFIDGRRVVQTSEKGSTSHLRKKWSESANKALLQANHTELIDHRSLKSQGIDRMPTRHRGWQEPKLEKETKTWVERIGDKKTERKVRFYG